MRWHNREKDWYNAERRFIFSAPNQKMLSKWITLIEKDKLRTEVKTNTAKNIMIGATAIKSATPVSAKSTGRGKKSRQKRFGDRVMQLTQETDTGYLVRDSTPVKGKANLSNTSGNIATTRDYTNMSSATLATGGQAQLLNESSRGDVRQDQMNSRRSSLANWTHPEQPSAPAST